MTTSLDMIRGRSNIVTLTNNSGGGLVAGDVCVQDTTADEKVTTTTSANSVLKVFVAAETISSGAAGRFYESGYCPLVNVSASVTRGRFLFTHTVAKQAAESATWGSGAFGKILKSGTTPSAIIYSATAQSSSGIARSGSTTGDHLAVWNGSNADSLKDGGVASGSLAFYGLATITAPPAVSGFTWVNQGGALTTESSSMIRIYEASASGTNLRVLKKAKGGSYKITMLCQPNVLGANVQCGFIWRQSSDGKLISYGPNFDAASLLLAVCKWNSATSVATYYNSAAYPLTLSRSNVWLQIEVDGSNRICRYSVDGIAFHQHHTIGNTDFLTADEVGYYIGNQSGTYAYPYAMTIQSWLEE